MKNIFLLVMFVLSSSLFGQVPTGNNDVWLDDVNVANGSAFQDLENWTKSKSRYKNVAALTAATADSDNVVVTLGEIAGGLGGGQYTQIDSMYPETHSGGAYDNATPGKQWVLLSYYLTRSDISVRDFGAKGDASTDDATAIQNAENFLAATGGGRLYWPKGSYYIQSTIIKYPEVEWIGLKGRKISGFSALDEKMKPHIFWDGANGGTMISVGDNVLLENMHYLRFENLRFIGTTGAPDTANYIIFVDTTSADNTYEFGAGFNWCEFSAYRNAAWAHQGAITYADFQNCRWDVGPGSGIQTRGGGYLIVSNFYVDTGGPTAPAGRPWYHHITDTSKTVTQSIIRVNFTNGKIEAHRPGLAAYDTSLFYFQQDPDFTTRNFAHVTFNNVTIAAGPTGNDPPYMVGSNGMGVDYLGVVWVNCGWEAGRWVSGYPEFMTGTGSFQSGRGISPFAIWAPKAAVPGEGPTANQIGVTNLKTRVQVSQFSITQDSLPTYKMDNQIVVLNRVNADADTLAIWNGTSWKYFISQ